jgi:ATP-binding cassette subfamily B protein
MEPFTARRFERSTRSSTTASSGSCAQRGDARVTGMLPALAMGLILLVGGRDIAAGRMAVSDFFTFAMYVYELTFPTFIMGWVVALVQRGAASMQRIDELLSELPTIADRPDAVALASLRGELEFRHLTFSYAGEPGREPALVDIDLRVPGRQHARRGGDGRRRARPRSPRSCRASIELATASSRSTVVDVNRIPLATLRRTSRWSRRRRSCSRPRSPRTSRSAGPTHARRGRARGAARASSPRTSTTCRTATTRSSASAA